MDTQLLLFSSILFGFLTYSSAKGIKERIVYTRSGKLRSKILPITVDNVDYIVDAFYGIDYATLFEKEYRFRKPATPLETWQGEKFAHAFGPVCPQVIPEGLSHNHEKILMKQSEECLNLNIYVPRKVIESSEKYPVMVIIHGGDELKSGSGNLIDGSVLAALGDVIVITLNYRLGALGFLPLQQFGKHDNPGLHDILAALDWIQETIQYFGGDKDRVTLYGVNHGVILVNTLLLSSYVQDVNLFTRCILQSSKEFGDWALTSPKSLGFIEHFSNQLNCTARSAMDCLMEVSAGQLVNVQSETGPFSLSYGPVVDNTIVSDRSNRYFIERDYSKGKFKEVQLMVGVENATQYTRSVFGKYIHGSSTQTKTTFLRDFVGDMFSQNRKIIYNILSFHYDLFGKEIRNKDISEESKMEELLSDGLLTMPMLREAFDHSENEDTFVFMVDKDFHHGVEGLAYILGEPLFDVTFKGSYSQDAKEMSKRLIKHWTNFVKTGNPNFPTVGEAVSIESQDQVYWPTYKQQNQEIVSFQRNDVVEVIEKYKQDKLSLWYKLLPEVQQDESGMHLRNIFPPPPPLPPMILNKPDPTPVLQKVTTPNVVPPKEDVVDTSPRNNNEKVEHENSDVPTGIQRNPQRTGASTEKDLKLSLPLIIGLGAGFVFINAAVLLAVCYCKKKKNKKNAKGITTSTSNPPVHGVLDDTDKNEQSDNHDKPSKPKISTSTDDDNDDQSTMADLHRDSQLELSELYKKAGWYSNSSSTLPPKTENGRAVAAQRQYNGFNTSPPSVNGRRTPNREDDFSEPLRQVTRMLDESISNSRSAISMDLNGREIPDKNRQFYDRPDDHRPPDRGRDQYEFDTIGRERHQQHIANRNRHNMRPSNHKRSYTDSLGRHYNQSSPASPRNNQPYRTHSSSSMSNGFHESNSRGSVEHLRVRPNFNGRAYDPPSPYRCHHPPELSIHCEHCRQYSSQRSVESSGRPQPRNRTLKSPDYPDNLSTDSGVKHLTESVEAVISNV